MSSLLEQLGTVRWDDLEGQGTTASGLLEYSSSKIMIIMMARELNKRLKVGFHAGCWACLRELDGVVELVRSKGQGMFPARAPAAPVPGSWALLRNYLYWLKLTFNAACIAKPDPEVSWPKVHAGQCVGVQVRMH